MSAVYHRDGIDLRYPENWRLSDSATDDGAPLLTFESPDGALLTMLFLPLDYDRQSAAGKLVEYLHQEFTDVEALQAEEELLGRQGTGFDCEFFYLDLLVSAWVRVFAGDRNLIAALAQAESRDFEKLRMVFKAIVGSAMQ